MRKLMATTSVTLDGVMQAPGTPDEDVRGGFDRGGWAVPYNDAAMAQKMGEGMAQTGAMLFGRRTYEGFYESWAHRSDGNPFTEILNNIQKCVASNTLTEPLPWANSTLLGGDAADAVAELKKQPGQDIAVIGSGDLVQSLSARSRASGPVHAADPSASSRLRATAVPRRRPAGQPAPGGQHLDYDRRHDCHVPTLTFWLPSALHTASRFCYLPPDFRWERGDPSPGRDPGKGE